MSVKSESYDGVAVISVEGDLSEADAAAAREAAQQAIDGRRLRDVVFDLSACGSLDSDGLEALLFVKGRCEQRYGRLKLAGCDAAVLTILEMTRLRQRFECCDTAEQALKLMRA